MHTNYQNYDKFPFIKVDGKAYSGFSEIRNVLAESGEHITVLDCYPIVDVKSLVDGFGDLFDRIFYSDTCAYSGDNLTDKMQKNSTHDRIFGVIT
ncbi:MAG: hypothetical protein ACI4LI_03090, partial [Candidatus Fimenecus sp.]